MSTICLFSMQGRRAITEKTLYELEYRGGGSSLQGVRKLIYYHGTDRPPAMTNWETYWDDTGPHGAVSDFWGMLRFMGYEDLIALEDDVEPCINFLPYAVDWFSPRLTTFFNGRNALPGLHPANWHDGRGFWFSQALKIPKFLLSLVASKDPRAYRGNSQDVILGSMLAEMHEPIYYHRSLVQHVGDISTLPGQSLTGKRAPAKDFVGIDYDAMKGIK